jgi:hypothetical protein
MLSMNSDQFRRSKPSQIKRKNDTRGTLTTNGPTLHRSSVQILKSAISVREQRCWVHKTATACRAGCPTAPLSHPVFHYFTR